MTIEKHVPSQKTTLSQERYTADTVLVMQQSLELQGSAQLVGAKNAVLVIMASLILTEGTSVLKNVPFSDDVMQMMRLLQDLGADVHYDFDIHELTVDTSLLCNHKVKPDIMKKMRASVLVMGPLLARFLRADIALPGGCIIGSRPINLHLKNFEKMGVSLQVDGEFLTAEAKKLHAQYLVLDYPSVGATENLLMAAVTTPGTTRIVNAALEPEVMDLISVLKKMGADITIEPPAILEIKGVSVLRSVEHRIIHDRLEAGSLLLSAAVVGGSIDIPQASWKNLDVFLLKLEEMGHYIERGPEGVGIRLVATDSPQAVSFVTGPYPGFPTDLQAPMMVAQCLASGKSVIHEAVFENRLLHVRELQKMGAHIVLDGDRATITGVDELYGANVIATDIRAACALVIAGLAAKGTTVMSGVQHWRRGYESLEQKLASLGARISLEAAHKVS